MTLKLNDVTKLSSLRELIDKQSLPIGVTYKLTKIFSAAEKEMEFYRTELRKLFDKYGEKDENGNLVPTNDGGLKIQIDYVAEVNRRINDLMNIDVDFPNIEFTLEELKDVHLSVSELDPLLPFIKE